MTTVERFWAKVDKGDGSGCWVWTAALSKSGGYGHFSLTRRTSVRAHRFAYELLVGPIPEGLVLDHLCRNPPCVRPDHLEPVTNRINCVIRADSPPGINLRKTHCPQGHEYTTENTYQRVDRPGRQCRECCKEKQRLRRASRREEAP